MGQPPSESKGVAVSSQAAWQRLYLACREVSQRVLGINLRVGVRELELVSRLSRRRQQRYVAKMAGPCPRLSKSGPGPNPVR